MSAISPRAHGHLTLSQEWRTLRRVYPIYQALALKFGMPAAPATSLRELSDSPDLNLIEAAIRWAAEVDRKVAPHQLRLFLQGGSAGNSEEQLSALLERHLEKDPKGEQDRDKVDVLLTQYFHVCAPPSYRRRDVRLSEVAEVLDPLLGEAAPDVPEWLEPLEFAVQQAIHSRCLRDLEASGALGIGRQLKLEAGESYFAKAAMLVFTRYNYVLRQSFLELRDADLAAINAGLSELARRGVQHIDASRALFSPAEPIADLQKVCATWRERRPADYFSDYSYVQLLELRTAVQEALHPPVDSRVEQLEAQVQELEQQQVQTRAFMEQLRTQVEQMRLALSASNTLLSALQKDLEALRAAKPQAAAAHPAATAPAHTAAHEAPTNPAHAPVSEKPRPSGQMPAIQQEAAKAPVEEKSPAAKSQAAASAVASQPGAPTVGMPTNGGAAKTQAPATHPTPPTGMPAVSGASATAPATKAAPAPAPGQNYPAYFQEWITRLKGALGARSNRRSGAFNIVVGSVSVLLTSPEVSAFLQRNDAVGTAMQRSVVGRILLVSGLDACKGSKQAVAALQPLVKAVEAERDNLQRVCKETSVPEDRDAMTATEVQLNAMLERAKKLAGAK